MPTPEGWSGHGQGKTKHLKTVPGIERTVRGNNRMLAVGSGMTGSTGTQIICAIVAGEHDLDMMGSCLDVRWRASIRTVKAALNRKDRPEYIFALIRARSLDGFFQARLPERDRYFDKTSAKFGVDTEHAPPSAETSSRGSVGRRTAGFSGAKYYLGG